MTRPRGIKGTTYTLGEKPVGSGGEGNVYHAYITNMIVHSSRGLQNKCVESVACL